MDMLDQIQSDILDDEVPISAILRKAKVLAAQLNSEELKQWASSELDGYAEISDLPDYRVIRTSSAGTWTGGVHTVKNRAVQMSMIDDEDLKTILSTLHLKEGVRKVEEMAEELGDNKRIFHSPDIAGLVNDHVRDGIFGYSTLHYSISPHDLRQVLDTIRNRLLDFILKIDVSWEVKESPPPQEDVSRLIQVAIYNQPEGGSVTVFDQRGQHVEYQFNSAGNINIGSITTLDALSDQLGNLRSEIEVAKNAEAVTEETAIESEFHLLQASKEATSDEPKKTSIMDHIGKAKELLEDAKAAVGLVAALAEAVEIVERIL